jgi:hypothetical protein
MFPSATGDGPPPPCACSRSVSTEVWRNDAVPGAVGAVPTWALPLAAGRGAS